MAWIPSLRLRIEHRLGAFHKKLVRIILASEMDEVAGGWRKLHSEELHCFCPSSYIIRVNQGG
jgi:hypothetical protein